MTSSNEVRVRKTPHALHAYTATRKGVAVHGWGNTPKEAREKLAEMERRVKEGTL